MIALKELLERQGCSVDQIDRETLGVEFPDGSRVILIVEEVDAS